MANVTLGPFLVGNGQSGLVAADLEHTGYSMEISSDEFARSICLYRQIHHWQPNAIRFEDFYVKSAEIPFELLPVAESRKQPSPVGTIVPMEAMLCSLYVIHEVTRSITLALEEFQRQLPINHCFYPRRDDGAQLVPPTLTRAGFEAIKFYSYGRTLSVQFGWVFSQDRPDAKTKLNVYAGTIEFKPQPDRSLDHGRWIVPCESSLSYLLTIMLETLGSQPAGLFSEAGRQVARDNFKWTKVSLLTFQEAKQARIDFVREHAELHANHQALARALKSAELYSETVELYAIKKQLPRLIREAGVKPCSWHRSSDSI